MRTCSSPSVDRIIWEERAKGNGFIIFTFLSRELETTQSAVPAIKTAARVLDGQPLTSFERVNTFNN